MATGTKTLWRIKTVEDESEKMNVHLRRISLFFVVIKLENVFYLHLCSFRATESDTTKPNRPVH